MHVNLKRFGEKSTYLIFKYKDVYFNSIKHLLKCEGMVRGLIVFCEPTIYCIILDKEKDLTALEKHDIDIA